MTSASSPLGKTTAYEAVRLKRGEAALAEDALARPGPPLEVATLSGDAPVDPLVTGEDAPVDALATGEADVAPAGATLTAGRACLLSSLHALRNTAARHRT
jgi:hypothetical protein